MLARSFGVTAAAIAVLTTAMPLVRVASAADMVTNTAAVRYQDLDLGSAAGEAALRQRIARAAKTVCWSADGPTIDDHARFDACRAAAIAGASPRLDAVIASVRSAHRFAMNGDMTAMSGR